MPATPNGITCVLFDLDGTLIDSAPDLAHAANHMRRKRGMLPLSLAHYRPWTGSGARGMLRAGFGIGPDNAQFGVLREEFFDTYQRCLLRDTRLFDGVAALLHTLQNYGLRWGIVTNKGRRFAAPLIAALPPLHTAHTLVCGDTTAHTKPHPAPLLEAMRQTRSAPGATVYVGDDPRDIQAGRAARVRTVAAAYGYLGAHPQLSAWRAHTRIDQPLQLLRWLEIA